MRLKNVRRIFGLFLILISASFYNLSLKAVGEVAKEEIRYVPIGDSYTVGQNVETYQAWPNLLVNHLNSQGVSIKLLANPSKTGWTTKEAINFELPVFISLKPTFATLLIGVNDWVRGVPSESFRKNLSVLLDKMVVVLPKKDHLLVITIPDFSVTPTGSQYGGERDISQGIKAFNAIINEEAKRRGLAVVDIFSLSQGMKNDSALISYDGLHPSAKEYELWEQFIYPEVLRILTR